MWLQNLPEETNQNTSPRHLNVGSSFSWFFIAQSLFETKWNIFQSLMNLIREFKI